MCQGIIYTKYCFIWIQSRAEAICFLVVTVEYFDLY